MNKRLKGIKENGIDIVKSTAKRVGLRTKEEEKEANKRSDICRDCDSNVEDKVLGGRMCDECYCPIKSLIYSKKGCELNKW